MSSSPSTAPLASESALLRVVPPPGDTPLARAERRLAAVSYTHLTLPTNREV